MIYLLAGIVGAALASNAPAAASNTNDPVEIEYHKILLDDDGAEKDVLEWMEKAGENEAGLTLNSKIQQRLDGIKREYQDFIERHPRHANARLAFGSFLNDSKDDAGARAQWEAARELAPANPAAWNNLGNYYGHSGQVAKALEYYGKAIELNPSQAVYYHNLAAAVYLFQGEAGKYYHLDEQQTFEKALALYRQAVKLDPENFILFSDYAMAFYGAKPPRWKEGLEAWTEALKLAPGLAEREGVHLHLARIHLKLGNFDQARENLDLVTNANYAVLKRGLMGDLNGRPAVIGH